MPRTEVGYTLLDIAKVDGVATCVNHNDTINYQILWNNAANPLPVTGVTIVDNLPSEVTFVSSATGGVYDPVTHTVTWNYANVPANYPGTVEALEVTVNPGVTPGSLITNYATIDSNETGPKTVTEQTLICAEEEEIIVGGEVYPVDKLGLLAHWLALSALLIPAIIVMRRRRARS